MYFILVFQIHVWLPFWLACWSETHAWPLTQLFFKSLLFPKSLLFSKSMLFFKSLLFFKSVWLGSFSRACRSSSSFARAWACPFPRACWVLVLFQGLGCWSFFKDHLQEQPFFKGTGASGGFTLPFCKGWQCGCFLKHQQATSEV